MSAPEPSVARFRIPNMDCAAEESEIRRLLEPVAGIASLSFHLGTRTLTVSGSAATVEAAVAALRGGGFEAQALSPESATAATKAEAHAPADLSGGIRRLILALVLASAAEGLAFFIGESTAVTAAEMLLSAAAIWLAGIDTYRKGLTALRHGRLNITALMTVAVTGAFLIGQWPEAAMVMALYAIAELIEARSLDRARNAIQSLMALAPETAEVRQADGSWKSVLGTDVPLEAIVRIRPGERVPLDGVVTAGTSAINQAPVTGESIPVDKAVGDAVFAGTINETAELEFRVTALANNTTLARIIHAVETAQGSRAPTQRFVDRFAAVYTPGVFVLALAVALLTPWLLGWTSTQALYKALVLLVIACPCALVISTPVTVVSALAAAAKRGILIKGGTYLEDARKLKAIALDKTGTITEGKPRLVESAVIDGQDQASRLGLDGRAAQSALLDQAMIAEHVDAAVHRALHAASRQRLEVLDRQGFDGEASCDRLRHRMVGARGEGHSESLCLGFVRAGPGFEVHQARFALGDGAGLVERHCFEQTRLL